MKLIYIVNARIPTEKAHGVQIMKMCEAFASQGTDVTLVVPRRKGVTRLDPFAHYSISARFPIVYLPICNTYEFGYWGFVFGSFSFAVSYWLYGLHQKLRHPASVFYSRDQDQFSFFPFFFGLRPYFFEVHGFKKKSALHARLFKRISGAVATNSFIKAKLTENFPRLADKIALMPNGVDLKKFVSGNKGDARKALSLPPEEKIVLYAGHFYAWKGVDTLVEAAASLPAGISVYLVGGNDEDIQRLKKSNPAGAARVTFIGYRPYSEMPSWYSAADLLVITGTAKDADSVHYTSPIKLFEYMAMERPIVAIDSPAIRDIVSEEDAYFYKPDDAGSLARSIDDAFADAGRASKKAASARRKIERYDWNNRAKAILEFITRSI